MRKELYNFHNSRKAQDAKVSSLILFIVFILAASLVVTVLVPSIDNISDELRYTTGESIKNSAFMLSILNLFGEDASDRQVELITMRIKIQPGSNTINFRDLILHGTTESKATEMILGQRIEELDSTWQVMDVDLVDFSQDGLADSIRLANTTHLQVNVSNGTKSYNYSYICSIPLKNIDEYVDLAGANSDIPVEIRIIRHEITCGGSKVGTVDVVGKVTNPNQFDSHVHVIVGHGTAPDFGAFMVDYVLKGDRWLNGYLTAGDAAVVKFVPHRPLKEADQMVVIYVPVRGVHITYYIETPTILNRDRVVLKYG